MNKKRPHESPDCRCAACVAYDYEQEDTSPYVLWAIECAAWQRLYETCEAILRGDPPKPL